ncbi:50S ribosomal protein L20 [Reticulomyxa filosa]|uniref:50S ribosomal protein L20 n=1 Tax=Reticulomyxa filosa TaxID=46433 RepID=X6N360_RETFI|nr:50S ribosomal protein L20 [Reticulomyxa filosa]|eukprot:ETO20496.1 50S ribosomal protein L20 [Reticulomyxa filosa]
MLELLDALLVSFPKMLTLGSYFHLALSLAFLQRLSKNTIDFGQIVHNTGLSQDNYILLYVIRCKGSKIGFNKHGKAVITFNKKKQNRYEPTGVEPVKNVIVILGKRMFIFYCFLVKYSFLMITQEIQPYVLKRKKFVQRVKLNIVHFNVFFLLLSSSKTNEKCKYKTDSNQSTLNSFFIAFLTKVLNTKKKRACFIDKRKSHATSEASKVFQASKIRKKMGSRARRTRNILYMQRISAASAEHDISYSRLLGALRRDNVWLSRPMLCDFALNEPYTFRELSTHAKLCCGLYNIPPSHFYIHKNY